MPARRVEYRIEHGVRRRDGWVPNPVVVCREQSAAAAMSYINLRP